MCGISFYFGVSNFEFIKTINVIKHRGPDNEGVLTYNVDREEMTRALVDIADGYLRVYMGHRRLAIINCNEISNQPFSRDDLNLSIVFNGEIYNYLELREELKQNGYDFVSSSDTEVLLLAYDLWGSSCLNRLFGMWSFVILDLQQKKVFAAVDRFSIKPLYYRINGNGVQFGSEIKQFYTTEIKKEPNNSTVLKYLNFNLSDTNNETFFKGVERIVAGSYVDFPLDQLCKTLVPIKWYYGLDNTIPSKLSKKEAAKQLKLLLEDSIRIHLRTDVKFASMLSGGVDSSSIVCIVAKMQPDSNVNAYHYHHSEQKYDESRYAEEVARLYPNVKINYSGYDSTEIINLLEISLNFHDEPFTSLFNKSNGCNV